MSDETPPAPDRLMPQLVLVTGPSGAGRSTAIRALEDMGFEAIDNMPFSLLPRLLDGRAPPDNLSRSASTCAIVIFPPTR